jgi:hypothetical protein
MGSSFPDLTTLIRHSESDETDRADEEINSPIDFLNVDKIRHNPADHGTFHFGFNTTEQNETLLRVNIYNVKIKMYITYTTVAIQIKHYKTFFDHIIESLKRRCGLTRLI